MKNLSPFAILALLMTAGFLGCNSAPDENVLSDYEVAGAIIQDLNSDSTLVIVSLDRDDRPRAGATVRLGALALVFDSPSAPVDSTYSLTVSPGTVFAGESMSLLIRDGNTKIDSAVYEITDTFSVVSRTPAIDSLTPPWTVSLDWGGSAHAETYVVAAVKASQAFSGSGYSAYFFDQTTAGTIPPDAFLLPVTSEPDTGLYYLYVYALSGAPDSALTSELLPVPLPQQLDENIGGSNVKGRFGSVYVVHRDSIRVALIR